MDWPGKVGEHFDKKRQLLLRSLEQARRARDEAPKPTESHSDTTMSEKEKLVTALEAEIKEFEKGLAELNKMSLAPVDLNELKIILVPDGMGGGDIEGVKLVSVSSPVGQKIKNGLGGV